MVGCVVDWWRGGAWGVCGREEEAALETKIERKPKEPENISEKSNEGEKREGKETCEGVLGADSSLILSHLQP